MLGAWVRATGSGLSCPDWPTCYGHWVPLPGDIPAGRRLQLLQVMSEWVHRLIAGVILGPLVLVIGGLAWRVAARRTRGCRPIARRLILLLLVQAALGGITVLDQNSPWSVALHLGTALRAVQRAVADLRAQRRASPGRCRGRARSRPSPGCWRLARW